MKHLSIIILFLILSANLFPQESDAELFKDLIITDRAFEKKYINQLNSVKELSKAYKTSDELFEKLFLMKRLCDFLNDDSAFNMVMEAINQSTPFPRHEDRYWKLRASAIYLLGEKGKALSKGKQLRILKMAVDRFKKDRQKRVVAASAFTLAKLSTDDPGVISDHRLFNKRTISYLFIERLLKLKAHENYLCWALAKASIRHGDPYCNLALREVRKKPFRKFVLSTVKRAMRELNEKKNVKK